MKALAFAIVGAILGAALGCVFAFAVVRWGWPLVYIGAGVGALVGLVGALGKKPREDASQ